MTKTTFAFYCFLGLVLFCFKSHAQVSFTANDQVKPYGGYFHPSANIGEYTSFSEETLAELAAGNPIINVPGVGVKALRPGLFESFLEQAGYQANIPTFEFYQTLGMNDHTVIVGFPSNAHRETEQFCPGFRSELFANLYEPIWDNGANGTLINEENYFALYMWKMVNTYKDYVRFWEIWNEPGFDYTGGLGFLPPGAPGNWWDNNPNPCDYKLRAPIFHYVRLLRISWEVIKSIDPNAYVVVSGTGYPSFLDAILRNTDNPVNGSISPDFPLRGGAYFDVMGFHSYPHFDGSLQVWSDQLNDWIYSRHSDAAANGLVKTKVTYQDVLDGYGYDGITYPEKLWMVTEVNLPRKQFGDYIGSEAAQRNFIIKAMVTAMSNDFLQLHIYKLAEDTYFENANSEFDLMGLYKRLDYNDLYFQEMNEEGIAHKTASDILYEKTFDPIRTADLALPNEIGGGAFADSNGNYTYVLWAVTQTDQSEAAVTNYSFPQSLNIGKLVKCQWDASVTHGAESIGPNSIVLSATPQFYTQALFTLDSYTGCVPLEIKAENQLANAVNYSWSVSQSGNLIATSNLPNPTFFFGAKGEYSILMKAFDGNGQLMAQQAQSITVIEPLTPNFEFEISGPIVHFENLSPFGNNLFSWDFGDGETSIDPVPTHVYLASGTYNVALTATNGCGNKTVNANVTVVSPSSSQLNYTANDQIPDFDGEFRPGISWEFVNGWTDDQLANLASGNVIENVSGAGIKSLRTYIGESFFIDQGYGVKKELFDHYENIDLRDNTFLLAFPSVQSRDPYFYCPEQQSAMFKDLYLEIWDNGENGTPVNDDNPWALYVYETVKNYGPYIKYWEIYNSPDYDLTGDRGWLPPGEPGNWWENNPDPCEYELRAPIFYYVRSLRIAYEVIKYLDEDDYVTISGIAFPSFLDAVCRNTDNPINGSVSTPYPLKGGAYFDAVGYKTYPHFDGSTIYFDPGVGNFAYERHSDAAVSGIKRVKYEFQAVLAKYGYDGVLFPQKEFIISEANIPRRQLSFYLGGEAPQINWTIKSWIESVRNDIRQLNFFRLAESNLSWLATDPFEVMGFYQVMNNVLPYDQTINNQGVALKTCSDFLFATDYNQQQTEAMQLPDGIDGAAFQDANGQFIYVIWSKTTTDMSEVSSANYSFPSNLNIDQLYRFSWDYSRTNDFQVIPSTDIELTGEPIFLTTGPSILTSPVAAFTADTIRACVGNYITFSSLAINQPQNWAWTFEGGIPNSHFGETPPPVLYETPGVFSVRLNVSNGAGEHTVTSSNLITIEAQPISDFEYSVDGATVQFVNLSSFANDYEWCYGDGVCNSAESPAYLYYQNGEYVVTLTASNGCGSSSTEQSVVIESAPNAAFQYQYTGNCDVPQAIFLDYSFSNPESWQWIVPEGNPSASDLRYPTINFPGGGEYAVTLIAGNDIGFDTITKSVYIEGHITEEIEITLCEGDSYNGMIISQDTVIITHSTTQSLGCDSIITANISIAGEVQSFVFEAFCEGDFFNGVPLFQDTFFVETFLTQTGCDSIVTTDVTVFPVEEIFLTEEIAFGEVILIGNEVFNQTGMYDILLQTIHGCDSLIHLDLTVITGLHETGEQGLELATFPNPFNRHLNIVFNLDSSQAVTIAIYDINGKLIKTFLEEKLLNQGEHRFTYVKELPAIGVFLIKVKTANTVSIAKVVGL